MAENLDELVPYNELSQHAQRLLDKGFLRRSPKIASQAEIVDSFNAVFQMIGGVPRLALWADQNPAQFYAMYSKLLPNAAKIELSVVDESNVKDVPTSELKKLVLRTVNGETIDQT
jgi:hypothetical protein